MAALTGAPPSPVTPFQQNCAILWDEESQARAGGRSGRRCGSHPRRDRPARRHGRAHPADPRPSRSRRRRRGAAGGVARPRRRSRRSADRRARRARCLPARRDRRAGAASSGWRAARRHAGPLADRGRSGPAGEHASTCCTVPATRPAISSSSTARAGLALAGRRAVPGLGRTHRLSLRRFEPR